MRTLIRDARLFDGEQVIEETDIVIDGTVIAAPDNTAADHVVDGAGRTVLPGLIDAHTHVFDGSLAEALRYGVTTELDMFCLPANLRRQRRLARERDDVADIRSAGTLATPPGGHPSQLMTALDDPDSFGEAIGAFDTIAEVGEAAAFVRRRIEEGADYLKVIIDDGALHGNRLPVMTAELAAALVAAGHDAGLQVVAHALSHREVVTALDAGVDVLAHVWTDNVAAADELAARVVEQGVGVVSTLAYFEAVGSGVEVDRLSDSTFDNAVRVAAALHRAGATLLAGTDATPFAPKHGAGLQRELQLLTTAGLTPLEALTAATSSNADRFGLTDRGRIAPGHRADLLLVDGDPTRDIGAVSNLVDVWRRGVPLGEVNVMA
ncbi:amidohydrolase family protein [Microlunatus soli]|uniref:Imidazolonepropionase n=1 Tax=Microlunatus soli TaxID=630515 RepID=A0A1H1QRT8_9ACTN|nr:amidohydrolase family protein [Microlunatus soli]SDS26023.1 Imidazolonepropionase [Microlunatus soli]